MIIKSSTLMYITNDPDVPQIAESVGGGERIFIDLETNDKEELQHNTDTVISSHRICDIGKIKLL